MFKQTCLTAIVIFIASAIPSFAQTVEAYKTGGTTAAGIFLQQPDSNGDRSVRLAITAIDIQDCSNTFSQNGKWNDICEKITKDEGNTQSFSGILKPVRGDLVLEGIVKTQDSSFEFELGILLNSDDQIIAVSTVNDDTGTIGNVIFDDTQSDLLNTTQATNYLNANLNTTSVEASIELDRPNFFGERQAALSFKYLGGDCAVSVRNRRDWLRLCETADKDGPQLLKGVLKPLRNDPSAFAGQVSSQANGAKFWIVVSQTRPNYAVVAIRKSDRFTAAGTPDNLIFDGTQPFAPPLAPNVNVDAAEMDLSSNDWRVETESISNFGPELELTFQKLSSETEDGYTGQLSMWFGNNPTGYCPETSAYLKICESVQKDGPLPMMFGIDRREASVKFGYSGAISVRPGAGVNWGAFAFDIMQGSSISDWGDQEPDALYLRISTLGTPPGAEQVGWLKMVPLNRSMKEITAGRTLSGGATQPPPPSNQSTTNTQHPVCAQFEEQMARIKSSNGLDSNGQPISGWDDAVRYVDFFTSSLRPDNGNGRSCEAGIKGIAATLAKLDAASSSQPVTPSNPTKRASEQPNGGTFCEVLSNAYSQISSSDEQNRARELLLRDARFGTWKLPTSELSCEVAAEIFAGGSIQGF